jgi:hypothetical protein
MSHISLLCLVVAAAPVASSVAAVTVTAEIHQLSPANAAEYEIAVSSLVKPVECPNGLQFWVRAPTKITSATLEIADRPDGQILRVPIATTELDPEPALAHPPASDVPEVARKTLEKMHRERGFLAPGFRGFSFCIGPELLRRATVTLAVSVGERSNKFITETYELGSLEAWLAR